MIHIKIKLSRITLSTPENLLEEKYINLKNKTSFYSRINLRAFREDSIAFKTRNFTSCKMSGHSRNTTDAIFLLTIIGELCATRKYIESEDHEAVIETGCRDLLKSVFFPAWRHVLLCRATNARNARANKGWNALVAGSGQVIPKGCHAPNEAWERKYAAPIDIILTFIRATSWMRRDRREIRISNDIFLKISSTKILFMMRYEFGKLLENHWGFNLLRLSKNQIIFKSLSGNYEIKRDITSYFVVLKTKILNR